VRADEKLTAFLELESATRACGELSSLAADIFSANSATLNGSDRVFELYTRNKRKEVRVCAHVCMVGLQRLHILDQLLLLLWCQIRPKVMTGVGIPL
jgi:hypothetical protein